MKRCIMFVAGLLLFCLSAHAADVVFQWDANPAADQVFGYSLYQSSAATGPWTKVADTGATTYTLAGLNPGVYYFHLTANNAWGESGPSNIVSTPAAVPALPAGLKIIAVIIAPDGTLTFRLVDPAEFFRS